MQIKLRTRLHISHSMAIAAAVALRYATHAYYCIHFFYMCGHLYGCVCVCASFCGHYVAVNALNTRECENRVKFS